MSGKLKPCPLCGLNKVGIETWSSGGRMYMVKCKNPDCDVPYEGYPAGRVLSEVIQEWNGRSVK